MASDHITRSQISVGENSRPLIARVNRRAKRLILKVDPVAGEIHVTAPSKRALPEAIRFAHERIDWIESQLKETLRARPFQHGMNLPLRGVDHVILHEPERRTAVRIDADLVPAIRVGGGAEHVNRRIVDWLKREAREALVTKVDLYCSQLGRKRGRVSIRDTRSRWGSCTADGAMSFSWRLILTPPPILDYVAAHECAHLIHLDHSPAFWRVVRELGVDARSAAAWFRAHGPALFAYGVDPR